jgi:hypothetical protein
MRLKLRKVMSCKKQIVYGLTVPNEIAIFFKGIEFDVEKSGCSIIYTSGGNSIITTKELKDYKFEDAKI